MRRLCQGQGLRVRACQDNDPHGVQRLLAMLRTQQDSAPTGSKPALPSAQPSSSAGETLSELAGADGVPVEGREDVRYISFAQALPHLTRLSRNEAFLSALLRLKVCDRLVTGQA